MANFEVWKLSIDVLLSCSLLFLAFRLARSGNLKAHSRKGMELEATLRKLVHDAEEAGKELNDELYRRQISLEKALENIERAENGIQTVTSLADQKCKEIDSLLSRTRQVMIDLKEQTPVSESAGYSQSERRVQSKTENLRSSVASAPQTQTSRRDQEIEPAKPSGRQAPAGARAYAAANRGASATRQASAQQQGDGYSSWLMEQAGSSAEPEHTSPVDNSLRNSIEVEVEREASGKPAPQLRSSGHQGGGASAAQLRERLVEALKQSGKPSPQEKERLVEDMEAIYDRAEALIRSGQTVQTVSSQLNIPLRRAQAISEMVQRERDYGFEDAGKSRLGSLGMSRKEDEFI